MWVILIAKCDNCNFYHIWSNCQDFVEFIERRTSELWQNIRGLTIEAIERILRDFVRW